MKITLHHRLKVTATINVWKINEIGEADSRGRKGSAEAVHTAQGPHSVLQSRQACHQNDCCGAGTAILGN